jgi:Fic family protein
MLNLIKIFKPNLGKHSPEQLVDLLPNADFAASIDAANHPKYMYFDDLKKWPTEFSKEKFWALVKSQRKFSSQPIVPVNFNDQNFRLSHVFAHQEVLHLIDSGKFAPTGNLTKKQLKEFANKALISECIYSAAIEDDQIKPASAKKTLLEATPNKTKQDEFVKQTQKNLQSLYELKILSPVLLKNLFGELRAEDDRFVQSPSNKKMVCYIAPTTAVFEKQFDELIKFANNSTKHKFIHPVMKAIILHFWALILKPFANNNGIFARGLYYWYLQNNGYEGLALLPLSENIKGNLTGYSKAISAAAQDDNDFTYFASFIFEMLQTSANNFTQTTKGKSANVVATIIAKTGLNQRQGALLFDLAKFKYARTNFTSYMKENSITRKTAADDLKFLEKNGYLTAQKVGKNVFYTLSSYNFLADV